MKYRKIPVVVEAIIWTGQNHREMFDFLTDSCDQKMDTYGQFFYIDFGKCNGGLVIKTLEGDMVANMGDYVIKEPFDAARGFYPCKPDVFKQTYEANE